jgi:hypothetical protein
VQRPAAGQREEEKTKISLKVNGGDASAGPGRAEIASTEGALRLSYPSKHRAKRGTGSQLALTLHVADGWHLQEPDGLGISAGTSSGSEFTFKEISLPVPSRIGDSSGEAVSGWHGTFEANLSFSVSPAATPGRHDVRVSVRYRACGEGVCRPEAVLRVSIPIEID